MCGFGGGGGGANLQQQMLLALALNAAASAPRADFIARNPTQGGAGGKTPGGGTPSLTIDRTQPRGDGGAGVGGGVGVGA